MMITVFSNLSRVEQNRVENGIKTILQERSFDSHDQYTPLAFCETVLNTAETFKSDLSSSVSVIANLEFLWLLKRYLNDLSNVSFFSPCPVKRAVAEQIGVLRTHIHEKFISKKPMSKFENVIGNPPYQHPTSTAQKIWIKFLEQALELSSGTISLVVPQLLFFGPSRKMVTLRENILKTHDVAFISVKHEDVFDVGEKVCYFVLTPKSENFTTTTFEHRDGSIQQISVTKEVVKLSKEDILGQSIISKLKAHPSLELRSDYKCSDPSAAAKVLLENGIISETKSESHNILFHHTAAQQYWIRKPAFQELRVMLNFSGGYYDPAAPSRYMPITTAVLGKSVEGVVANDYAHAERIRAYLSSKLIRFFVEYPKTSGFNSFIYCIPTIDTSRSWSDEELYTYFNLTQEEIELIIARY